MFGIELKNVWLLYLVTSYSVFTIPEPVFGQRIPVTLYRSGSTASNNYTSETNPAEPVGGGGTGSGNNGIGNTGGEEPIALASSYEVNRLRHSHEFHSYSLEDHLIEGETFLRSRNKHSPRRGKPKRVPRHRKPHHSRPSKKYPPTSPKPILLKPSRLTKKPKLFVPKYKYHFGRGYEREKDHDDYHLESPRRPPPHHPDDDHIESPRRPPPRHPDDDHIESPRRPPPRHRDQDDDHQEESLRRPPPRHHGHDHHQEDSRKLREEHTSITSEKDRNKVDMKDPNPPAPKKIPSIRDDFFSTDHGGTSPSNSIEVQSPRGRTRGEKGENSQPSKTPTHAPTIYIDGHRPFPKNPSTVELSYYYDSKDGNDLRDLYQNHHLRRRKECDGLENFIYDLELVSFFLGLITSILGFYTDVIPFFNSGVKITYNNDLLGHGGHGGQFPHDYWPNHDSYVDVPGHKRTISIGSTHDNQKEVIAVAGEFVGLFSLWISFIGLFPSLVEKFFYGLDWWFGKRGLWKQFLYTYKCEIHRYPKPGWGR